jgi:hypothetical protein
VDCLFVGAGGVASEYAAALPSSSLRLVGVCDTDRGRADALAADRDAVRVRGDDREPTVAAVPTLLVYDGPVRWLLAALLGIAAVYTLLRRRLVPYFERFA